MRHEGATAFADGLKGSCPTAFTMDSFTASRSTESSARFRLNSRRSSALQRTMKAEGSRQSLGSAASLRGGRHGEPARKTKEFHTAYPTHVQLAGGANMPRRIFSLPGLYLPARERNRCPAEICAQQESDADPEGQDLGDYC